MARDRGLLTDEQVSALEARIAEEERALVWFRGTSLTPDEARPVLEEAGSSPITQATRAGELLRRPRVSAFEIVRAAAKERRIDVAEDIVATVEVEMKYAGYVERERARALKLRAQADFVLDEDLPYADFVTISYEAREKLATVRPGSLAQAGRIPGVSPSDLQNLMLEVRRRRAAGDASD